MIESPTLTTPVSTLTVLLISKSTSLMAVIFGIEALLLDGSVSFSEQFTTTTLEMFPTEMTLAIMISCLQSSLVRLPMYQTPASTS